MFLLTDLHLISVHTKLQHQDSPVNFCFVAKNRSLYRQVCLFSFQVLLLDVFNPLRLFLLLFEATVLANCSSCMLWVTVCSPPQGSTLSESGMPAFAGLPPQPHPKHLIKRDSFPILSYMKTKQLVHAVRLGNQTECSPEWSTTRWAAINSPFSGR